MPQRLAAGDWLARAEEARMLAEGMRDEISRRAMLQIAASYEILAAQAFKAGEVRPPPRLSITSRR